MRAFRAALRRQSRDLGASGVRMALTGPWPPYHFVDAGREARRS
jgi:Gas vesicle synthesis protein GvpL/GvpF